MMRMFKKNKKGFTLIELVIVVAVLAILAVVAVPIVGNIITDANNSVDEANLALYQGVLERHAVDNNSNYPASAIAAVNAIKNYTNLTTVSDCKNTAYKFYYVQETFQVTEDTVTIIYKDGQLIRASSDPDGDETKAVPLIN